jgi:hypothetical protein
VVVGVDIRARAVASGVFAAVVALAVASLDVIMLGHDLHWGWTVTVGLVSLVGAFALTLLIWKGEV